MHEVLPHQPSLCSCSALSFCSPASRAAETAHAAWRPSGTADAQEAAAEAPGDTSLAILIFGFCLLLEIAVVYRPALPPHHRRASPGRPATSSAYPTPSTACSWQTREATLFYKATAHIVRGQSCQTNRRQRRLAPPAPPHPLLHLHPEPPQAQLRCRWHTA